MEPQGSEHRSHGRAHAAHHLGARSTLVAPATGPRVGGHGNSGVSLLAGFSPTTINHFEASSAAIVIEDRSVMVASSLEQGRLLQAVMEAG